MVMSRNIVALRYFDGRS